MTIQYIGCYEKHVHLFLKKVKMVQKVILEIVRTTQSVSILKSTEVVIFRYLSKINNIKNNFDLGLLLKTEFLLDLFLRDIEKWRPPIISESKHFR